MLCKILRECREGTAPVSIWRLDCFRACMLPSSDYTCIVDQTGVQCYMKMSSCGHRHSRYKDSGIPYTFEMDPRSLHSSHVVYRNYCHSDAIHVANIVVSVSHQLCSVLMYMLTTHETSTYAFVCLLNSLERYIQLWGVFRFARPFQGYDTWSTTRWSIPRLVCHFVD